MAAAGVRLLGPVEVEVDGRPVAIGGERQRALVAALALAHDRPVGVAELVLALWGDDAAEHDHRLQQQVSSLRKLLEPDRARNVDPTVLLTAAPGYLLHCSSVDVERFEQLAADATGPGAGPVDVLAGTTAALALWRGSALADVRVSSWFDGVAVRLEERRLAVSEVRIDALLSLGRAADAAGELDQLIARAPYRERFRAQLMLALYRGGRQADALAVFRATRALLGEELGIEPGPELRQLELSVLNHDPALDLPTPGALGGGGRTTEVGPARPTLPVGTVGSVGGGVGSDGAPAGAPAAGAAGSGLLGGELVDLAETVRPEQLDRGYVLRPDGQLTTLVEGTTVIGRDPAATVQLVDSRVSRRHARIDLVDGTYHLHDSGSTNGTTLNGQPAAGQALRDGDVIGLGSLELRFHQGGAGA